MAFGESTINADVEAISRDVKVVERWKIRGFEKKCQDSPEELEMNIVQLF